MNSNTKIVNILRGLTLNDCPHNLTGTDILSAHSNPAWLKTLNRCQLQISMMTNSCNMP